MLTGEANSGYLFRCFGGGRYLTLTLHGCCAAFMYILAPMPYLLFGSPQGGGDGYSLLGGGDSGDGWQEAGKFLTGFGVIGSVGVPAVLLHAGMIATGAFLLQLASVAVLFLAVLLWEHWAVQEQW
jgi:hypothetical protein